MPLIESERFATRTSSDAFSDQHVWPTRVVGCDSLTCVAVLMLAAVSWLEKLLQYFVSKSRCCELAIHFEAFSFSSDSETLRTVRRSDLLYSALACEHAGASKPTIRHTDLEEMLLRKSSTSSDGLRFVQPAVSCRMHSARASLPSLRLLRPMQLLSQCCCDSFTVVPSCSMPP